MIDRRTLFGATAAVGSFIGRFFPKTQIESRAFGHGFSQRSQSYRDSRDPRWS